MYDITGPLLVNAKIKRITKYFPSTSVVLNMVLGCNLRIFLSNKSSEQVPLKLG